VNKLPPLDDVDNGIKRKLRAIPFNNQFVDKPTEPHHRWKRDVNNEEREIVKHQLVNAMIDIFFKLNNFKIDILNQLKI